MPISVLRLKVDKDQGLCSGILALIKCVLPVQWKCRQELKLFLDFHLNWEKECFKFLIFI